METPEYIETLRIVGGNLALDFVNTLGGAPDQEPEDEYEHLHSYEDLVAWAHRLEVLTETESRRLLRSARRQPRDARAIYRRALRLRTDIYEVFRALALGRNPPARSIGALRRAESAAIAQAELASSRGRFEWSWAGSDDLAWPLCPVVHAAVTLLTSERLDRLKICGSCRWLFVDESKNRSRRWCTMEECGTHEKMRRYVARRAATMRR